MIEGHAWTIETDLDVRFLDGRRWLLVRDFRVVLGGWRVTVPRGFLTDFVSSPRFFWRLWPPIGRYAPAAVVHDWLYRSGSPVTRREADCVFRRLMEALEVPAWQRWPMWVAVRLAGRHHWGRE